MTDLDERLDPEIATAIAAMPRMANGSALDLTDIPALRELIRADAESLGPVSIDPTVDVERIAVPRDDGTDLAIVLARPGGESEPLPVVLWFHAGGQVLGTAEDDLAYIAALAADLRCAVAAVDFRLAPETQAPGAAEDGYLAYTYLIEHGTRHGVDTSQIAIAGASGGGAPATATALMVRDQGLTPPSALVLLYPMLDDRNDTRSSHEVVDVGIWDRRENLLAWQAVLGDRAGDDTVDPYSAPGRATDLTGLPATFVAAAQWDVFRDEDLDFAHKLVAAGVPTDIHLYAGAVHAWDRFAPTSRLTQIVESEWHGFLRRHLRLR